MIYVMSQKFFKKNIKKLAKYQEYFILDGCNYGIVDMDSSNSIAQKYQRAHAVGAFCPEAKLYSILKKKKKGEDVNEDKFKKETDKFLKDKVFASAAAAAFKALTSSGENTHLNIFVVLPNIVYKYLGKKIAKRLIKLSKLEFNFVFTQKDIEDDMKLLNVSLNNDQLREVHKAAQKIEKKFKLMYGDDPDEY